MGLVRINAKDVPYQSLNHRIRALVASGEKEIVLDNILGQRFIGDGIRGDLAMFMSGPTIIVHGNADHAPGNTMDNGRVIIHGSAGDAVAHSMRGGRVYVRDNIGYRGGINMKQYLEKRPILVVGGSARAFLGEYMAGGLVIVLGLDGVTPVSERGVGSGIHGGEIIVRGSIDTTCLGVGAEQKKITNNQKEAIRPILEDFARAFTIDPEPVLAADYSRIIPASTRPFANKYTWE